MTTQHVAPLSTICAFLELGGDRHKLEAYSVEDGLLCRPLKGHNRIFASFAAAVRFAHRHGYLA